VPLARVHAAQHRFGVPFPFRGEFEEDLGNEEGDVVNNGFATTADRLPDFPAKQFSFQGQAPHGNVEGEVVDEVLVIRIETYKSQDRVAMDAPRRQSVKL